MGGTGRSWPELEVSHCQTPFVAQLSVFSLTAQARRMKGLGIQSHFPSNQPSQRGGSWQEGLAGTHPHQMLGPGVLWHSSYKGPCEPNKMLSAGFNFSNERKKVFRGLGTGISFLTWSVSSSVIVIRNRKICGSQFAGQSGALETPCLLSDWLHFLAR